jgi:hypothetical protein
MANPSITKRKMREKMKGNKTHNPTVAAGALLLIALMFSFDVSAGGQNPCSEDIAKFCGETGPGRTALFECLEAHETQLSEACRNYEGKIGGRRESQEEIMQQLRIRQGCEADIAKLCPDVKPGVFGMATCLKAHKDELSPSCLEAVKATKGPAEETKTK